ncbi:hypothetical protein [Brasilonema sp. UFV-L1]|uniref:hypothetical protein n=1 Tax=Brasilonema sp. UFV-L1 TaxID=2234130 RepID=UPI00145CB9E4|nr:hypothetical protein [Brasilonema sp. UFV-L1]
MNTIDAVILTLLNTIACFAFPKLLSVIMAPRNKRTVALPTAITSQTEAYQSP